VTAFEGLRDGGDVLGGVAAAAAGDVDEARVGELAEEAAHVRGLEVEARRGERVGQARVGVAGDGRGGLLRQLGEEGVHQVGAEGAVEADGEGLTCSTAFQKASTVWAEIMVSPPRPTAAEIMMGSEMLSAANTSSDGDEGGLGVERVEDGLDQQQVDPAREQGPHLLRVGRFTWSKVTTRKPASSASGELESDTVSGPMAPATKRGRRRRLATRSAHSRHCRAEAAR
jgi:hypothetical protein